MPYLEVVLFDADCILCNNAVNFILNHEKNDSKLYFASLNSKAALELKEKYNIAQDLDSIIFISNGKLFIKSEAIIVLSAFLKFPFNFIKFGRIIPGSVRDILYDYIAKNRKKFFKGSSNECQINLKNRNRILE